MYVAFKGVRIFNAALMLIGHEHNVNEEIEHWAAVDILIYERKSEFVPLLLDNGLNLLRKNYYLGDYVFADLLKLFPKHTDAVVQLLSEQVEDRLGDA